MRGECFRDGWCATKRERRGREGRKRAAREFAKFVKSEVKSLRNVSCHLHMSGSHKSSLLTAVGEGVKDKQYSQASSFLNSSQSVSESGSE